jgi:TetR/AcrR family transcriptional regulator, mexJK operon transcriptional repressor
MTSSVEDRSFGKRRAIVEAATSLFLGRGYDGTSMDDVAGFANVSKPTVYNHFDDKEQLFAEVVQATADRIDGLVRLVGDTLSRADDVEKALTELARQFIGAIMQPQTLRLRRLVIANADRFPDVGRRWYKQGFERVLMTLAESFESLSSRGLLHISDPHLAADHFVGLLLWIPVNRAMFTGNYHARKVDLERYSQAAVRAFLHGYRFAPRGEASREGTQDR